MPITTNKPLRVGNKNYNRVAVSLAISPIWGETDIGANIAIRFDHYRKDNVTGQIERLANPPPVEGQAPVDYSTSLVFSESVMQDPVLLTRIRKLLDSVQDMMNDRGM